MGYARSSECHDKEWDLYRRDELQRPQDCNAGKGGLRCSDFKQKYKAGAWRSEISGEGCVQLGLWPAEAGL